MGQIFPTASLHRVDSISYALICEKEESVPRITDWPHEACRMMAYGDREGRIFLSHPHKNNGLFFLLTTKYCILYLINMKKASRKFCIR